MIDGVMFKELVTDADERGFFREIIHRYSAIISTTNPQCLVNRAELRVLDAGLGTATAAVLANPFQDYLPLVVKDRRDT